MLLEHRHAHWSWKIWLGMARTHFLHQMQLKVEELCCNSHSFNKYMLSCHSVSGIALDSETATVNKTDANLCPQGADMCPSGGRWWQYDMLLGEAENSRRRNPDLHRDLKGCSFRFPSWWVEEAPRLWASSLEGSGWCDRSTGEKARGKISFSRTLCLFQASDSWWKWGTNGEGRVWGPWGFQGVCSEPHHRFAWRRDYFFPLNSHLPKLPCV